MLQNRRLWWYLLSLGTLTVHPWRAGPDCGKFIYLRRAVPFILVWKSVMTCIRKWRSDQCWVHREWTYHFRNCGVLKESNLETKKKLQIIMQIRILFQSFIRGIKLWKYYGSIITSSPMQRRLNSGNLLIQGVPPICWQLRSKFWKLKNHKCQKVSPVLKFLN